jgi:hypothetical protein
VAQREGSEVGEAAWEGGGAAEASPWSRQGGRQQGGGEEAVAELDWKLGVGRHFFCRTTHQQQQQPSLLFPSKLG